MFKKIVLLLILFISLQSHSQSFTNNTGGNIFDNSFLYFPVTVSGLPNNIDSVNFGLVSICINITHTYVGQLDLYLKSPTGNMIKLCNNKGSNGKNFTNTCFREDGNLPIQSGLAPFLGTYIPETSINLLNDGSNPNGIWYLGVADEIPFNTGKVNSFSISFGNNPPGTPVLNFCTTTNGAGCKCPDGSQDCDLLPDMTNSAKVIQGNYYDEDSLLHIGVGTPNIGYGPLDVRGTGECFCDTIRIMPIATPNGDSIPLCPNGTYPKEKVVQRVYHKTNNNVTYTERFAGYMLYHPEHGHIHLEDWTFNSLRMKGPEADPTKWPILGKDAKVSFCLVNNFNCSANLGYCVDNSGANLPYDNAGNPGMGTASGCGREQGIFPGYLDIYFPGYDGQEIKLGGDFCNGWYYVVSITDPHNNIKEIDETNNVAVVPVYIAFQNKGECCKAGFYADTLSAETPFTVQFKDTSKPNSDKWFWDFGDGTTDTTQFPIHTYTRSGVYDVTLQTNAQSTNCKDSITKKGYIVVRNPGTPDNVNNIKVVPNPFKDDVKVYYNLLQNETVSIAMYDAAGRAVYQSGSFSETQGAHVVNVPSNKFPAGAYIVKVTVGNEVRNFKTVKQ